jgi:hypothetical protein
MYIRYCMYSTYIHTYSYNTHILLLAQDSGWMWGSIAYGARNARSSQNPKPLKFFH